MSHSLVSPWSRRRVLGGLIVVGAAVAGVPAFADTKRVLVLLSDAGERSLAITSAFKANLSGGLVMTYDLGQQADAGAFIADNIRGLDVGIVFAVGDLAARAATREFASVPIVHADVQDIASMVERPGLEAVSAWPDPKATLERLSRVVRPLNSVGVVRTARTNAQVDAIEAAGKELGINILVRTAGSSGDVENAIAGLLSSADIVWLLHDASVLPASLVAKVLHKATVEQKLVATWSRAHLEGPQPAAIAIGTGPEGVGQAAALRVSELLAGNTQSQAAYAAPRLFGNLESLRRGRVAVNKAVAAEFDEMIK